MNRMRLDKFLSDMQIGTRSTVKDLIKKGQVSVNDTLVKNPGFQVDTEQDLVTCMGNPITYQRLYYYMLHKPGGVVTATRDHHASTVMALLPDASGKHLAPVGQEKKIALPFSHRARILSFNINAASGSSPTKGSSKISSFGSWSSAPIMASFCRIP